MYVLRGPNPHHGDQKLAEDGSKNKTLQLKRRAGMEHILPARSQNPPIGPHNRLVGGNQSQPAGKLGQSQLPTKVQSRIAVSKLCKQGPKSSL